MRCVLVTQPSLTLPMNGLIKSKMVRIRGRKSPSSLQVLDYWEGLFATQTAKNVRWTESVHEGKLDFVHSNLEKTHPQDWSSKVSLLMEKFRDVSKDERLRPPMWQYHKSAENHIWRKDVLSAFTKLRKKWVSRKIIVLLIKVRGAWIVTYKIHFNHVSPSSQVHWMLTHMYWLYLPVLSQNLQHNAWGRRIKVLTGK